MFDAVFAGLFALSLLSLSHEHSEFFLVVFLFCIFFMFIFFWCVFQVMVLKSKEEYETLVKAIGHKQTKRIFRSDDMKRFFKIFQSRGPIVEA